MTLFKVVFEGVKEIGRWAWENIKAIFTDDEGPSLGDLIFKNLPEATKKAREEMSQSAKDLATDVISYAGTIATGVADILNISFIK